MEQLLVVEPDDGIRQLFKAGLADEGYKVITTPDGVHIIDLIDKYRPDAVIMEAWLRPISGLDLLQAIRRRFYNLPVILCSTYEKSRYDPRAAAADYFVVKSSNLDELKNKIRKSLEGGCHLSKGKESASGSRMRKRYTRRARWRPTSELTGTATAKAFT